MGLESLGLAKSVCYNAVSLHQGSFSYILLFTGVKKIVSYTAVLVVQRFVILRFDCTIIIKIAYL